MFANFEDSGTQKLIRLVSSVLVLPVLLVGLDIGLEGVLVTLLPLGWAHFSVLVDVLEGLDQSENLVDVSSDWKVVVGGVSQNSLAINNESGSIKVRMKSRKYFLEISEPKDKTLKKFLPSGNT